MAEKVALWPSLYGIDGIDLDLETGAGDTQTAADNMVIFVKRLREVNPTIIISQPVFGFPQVSGDPCILLISSCHVLHYIVDALLHESVNSINWLGD